jgi:hypothetical protein
MINTVGIFHLIIGVVLCVMLLVIICLLTEWFKRDPLLFPYVYWFVHFFYFLRMLLPIIIAIVSIIINLVFSEAFLIRYTSDLSGGAGSTSGRG